MGGSLGDQLLKGLVDEKQVRQAQHEQRTSRKRKGRRPSNRRKPHVPKQLEHDGTTPVERTELVVSQRTRWQRVMRAKPSSAIVVSGRVEGRTNGRRRFYARLEMVVYRCWN